MTSATRRSACAVDPNPDRIRTQISVPRSAISRADFILGSPFGALPGRCHSASAGARFCVSAKAGGSMIRECTQPKGGLDRSVLQNLLPLHDEFAGRLEIDLSGFIG